MSRVKAIAAVAQNGVIGRGMEIPWRISDEFKHFKATTMGGVIVFGRRTWESLGSRALAGRENVVVSSRAGNVSNADAVFENLGALFAHYASDPRTVWICGGARLYAAAFPFCEELILSRVKLEPEGDVFFPDFSEYFLPEPERIMTHPQFDVLRYLKK